MADLHISKSAWGPPPLPWDLTFCRSNNLGWHGVTREPDPGASSQLFTFRPDYPPAGIIHGLSFSNLSLEYLLRVPTVLRGGITAGRSPQPPPQGCRKGHNFARDLGVFSQENLPARSCWEIQTPKINAEHSPSLSRSCFSGNYFLIPYARSAKTIPIPPFPG